MNAPRYLCSHLVELSFENQTQWVNLEEIWENGASLEGENEIAAGVPVRISVDSTVFEGHITDARKEEFGWRLEVEFRDDNRWSPERWRPEHLLDPRTLKHAE